MVLLDPGVTLVSRNGMEPSDPCSSTVNCMLGSCELMCCSSCWLCSAFWMTRVSSTNLNQRLRGGGQIGGLWLQALPWTGWLWGGWWGNPWLHHGPVHSTYLGRGSRYFWGRNLGVWQFGEWTFESFGEVLGPVWAFVELWWLQGQLALKWIGPWHHMKKWPPLVVVWPAVFFLWCVGFFWDDVKIFPPVDVWHLPAP